MAGKIKITKQFIISQTILYVFIMAFVITFRMIFGDKNILIGVMGITAILMLTQINLTVSPGRNFFKLLIINLGIGIFTYIANLNIWLAIPINFIGVFILTYTFYYNLKTAVYLPFILQYMFLLATPITKAELPMRMLSLLVAPVGIILIQFAINKNKTTKSGNKLIGSICDNIIKKINNTGSNEEINDAIKSDANSFRKIVYDSRKDDFYVTEEGRLKLNIVIILEKLSILLESNIKNKKITNDLQICLQELKRSLGKEDELKDIDNVISKILNNYNREDINDLVELRILNTINRLKLALEELKLLGKENYNKIKSSNDIPEEYKMANIHKREFYTKSVKFSYAIRLSLGITISAFIADYFKFVEGRWIYFTAFAIIIPIYELAQKKLRDRIFATLVGGAIVVISFTIFKNATIRMLILMVAGYLRSYTSTYRYGTIYTTISAIGAAAMTSGAIMITMDRITFVIFGIIIAVIINRLVLPVKMKDANEELLGTYKQVIYEMLNNVYKESLDKNNSTHEMDTLLLVTTMIEERLAVNNADYIKEDYTDYFNKMRILIIDIYQLYTLIRIKKNENNDISYLNDYLKVLPNINNVNINEVIKKIEENIKASNEIDNKIIFANIRGVLTEVNEIKNLSKILSNKAV